MKEREEARENLGALKGEAICFGFQDSHLFPRLLTRVKKETIFGSKDSRFLLRLGQWRKTLAVLYITPVVHMLLRLLTWSYHPCLSEY